MTPEQKGSLPLRLEKLFYELQDRVFTDIVRRIKKTGEITVLLITRSISY